MTQAPASADLSAEELQLLTRWCALGWHTRAQRGAARSPAGLNRVWHAAGRPVLASESQRKLEDWLAADNRVLFRWSANFPSLLGAINDPPVVLFVRGQLAALSQPRVAMVGSRAASHWGVAMARRLSAQLSQAGVLVVSGLAQGIDRAAHEGALSVGHPTLSIPGSGLGNLYPRQHQNLAGQIVAAGGLLISEYAPWVAPHKANFPARNRLISGLAAGVVVVQAALRSGSLITARLAADQGREVMAVPAAPGARVGVGCNALLREGAALIETGEDVFTALGWTLPEAPAADGTAANPASTSASATAARANLAGEAQRVLAALDSVPLSVEALTQFIGLPGEEIANALLELELRGLVQATAHGYIRAL